MGCDIHLGVEKKIDGKWKAQKPPKRPDTLAETYAGERCKPNDPKVSPFWGPGFCVDAKWNWFHDRNYFLFGVLAGVRSNEATPIDYPRGLPRDRDASVPVDNFGDHSFSWLTLRELRMYDWDHVATSEGVIPLTAEDDPYIIAGKTTYDRWGYEKQPMDRSTPESWSAAVTGAFIRTIDEDEADRMLEVPRLLPEARKRGERFYVRVHWGNPARTRCARFVEMLEGYIAPLCDEKPKCDYDDVRIVFGFDS